MIVEVDAVSVEGLDIFDELGLELRLDLEEFGLDLGSLGLKLLPGVAQRVASLRLLLIHRQVMLDQHGIGFLEKSNRDCQLLKQKNTVTNVIILHV